MPRPATLAGSAALILALQAAAAAGGDGFGVSREVVAGGGTRAAGGPYVLLSTHAQPVVGVQGGGEFRLLGGFHLETEAASQGDDLFRDGFEG